MARQEGRGAATKQRFAKSLHELVTQKPIGKVTVGEICTGAGKSPATFYRHFHDKYALAAWDYAQRPRSIVRRLSEGGYTLPEALADTMDYYWDNRAYLSNLLSHTEGFDSFVRYMNEASVAILQAALATKLGCEPSQNLMLCVRAYCYGTIRLVCDWIEGSFTSDPTHMAQVMLECLPAPLYDTLAAVDT